LQHYDENDPANSRRKSSKVIASVSKSNPKVTGRWASTAAKSSPIGALSPTLATLTLYCNLSQVPVTVSAS